MHLRRWTAQQATAQKRGASMYLGGVKAAQHRLHLLHCPAAPCETGPLLGNTGRHGLHRRESTNPGVQSPPQPIARELRPEARGSEASASLLASCLATTSPPHTHLPPVAMLKSSVWSGDLREQ